MSSLSQPKILGGTGWILLLLSIVPRVGFILGIIGIILVLIATKIISDVVSDGSIFQNMIISSVLGIVGILVVEFVVLAALSRITSALRGLAGTSHPAVHFGGRAVELVVGLLIIEVVFILYGYFVRKSFNAIAQKTNVGLFKTGALVLLIGAALTIIFVGFLILLISDIVLAIAFFTLPEQLPTGPSSISPPMGSPSVQQDAGIPSSTIGGNKFCSKCGASIPEGTIFCPSCGQRQA